MEITSVGQFQPVKWVKEDGYWEREGGKEWRKAKIPVLLAPHYHIQRNPGAQFNGRADGFTRVDSARPVVDQ